MSHLDNSAIAFFLSRHVVGLRKIIPAPLSRKSHPQQQRKSDVGAKLSEAAASNAHQENPRSPPLPPKPIPQTPGPRAQRLQELYSHALSHTFRKISFENFSACYPTIASQAPGTLHSVHRQMIDRLSQLCNNEFSLIMENRKRGCKAQRTRVSNSRRRKEESRGG